MGLAFLIITAIIVCYFMLWFVKHMRIKRIIDQIPGPWARMFLGNAHQFKYNSDDWQEQGEGVSTLWNTPRMFRVWLFTLPYVTLNGADEVEAVLSSNVNINKSREYRVLWPWLGMGLLTNYGEKWRPRRKLLTPAFHYDILKDFMGVFNKQAKIFVTKLQQHADTDKFNDVYPYVTLCALDIICETAMGQDVNAQSNKDSKYVKAIITSNEIMHERQKRPWVWPPFLFNLIGRGKEMNAEMNIIHGFTEKVIRQRMEKLRETNGAATGLPDKKRLAFLDLLLTISEKEKWSFEDLRDEVNTFMFEGHDTTSASMNWTLHLLGCYPDIQEKIHNELDALFGDDQRDIEFDDLKQLHYLECCIKESLRLFPSVPMFGRHIEEDVNVSGKCIPRGSTVFINPYMVHRDPTHWPDPERFIPERFLPENSVGRHPYAYVPFSAGSRNCIGQRFALMEEKTVLAWCLRFFRIKSLHRRDQIRAKPELILRPDRGVHLKLQLKRKPSFEFVSRGSSVL